MLAPWLILVNPYQLLNNSCSLSFFLGKVGGKNASLGEMIGQLTGKGVKVPGGMIIIF